MHLIFYVLKSTAVCVVSFYLLSSAVFSKRCQNSREIGKWSSGKENERQGASLCWHSSSLRSVDSFKIKLLFLEL